jgi:integrase
MDGGSLIEAVRFYRKHNTTKLPHKPVGEVVSELLQAKTMDGMSTLYVSDLRLRLTRFAARLQGHISDVTGSQIEDFLRALNVAPRTRNNFRCGIGTLFSFAQSRGYLPKGETEFDSVSKAKGKTGTIQIFTPAQMKKLLHAAGADLVPFLAIGAFAGLRHQEIKRLQWPQVRLDKDSIEVKAGNSKTASRRLVPISPNLKRWLKPHWQSEGNVVSFANMTNRFLKLSKVAGVKWSRNVLRHSFISYRLAEVQDAAKVALEAGNSPKMIFEHYRELVFAEDATRWFSINPKVVRKKAASKIVPLTLPEKAAA